MVRDFGPAFFKNGPWADHNFSFFIIHSTIKAFVSEGLYC
jgi:hypothetical protein